MRVNSNASRLRKEIEQNPQVRFLGPGQVHARILNTHKWRQIVENGPDCSQLGNGKQIWSTRKPAFGSFKVLTKLWEPSNLDSAPEAAAHLGHAGKRGHWAPVPTTQSSLPTHDSGDMASKQFWAGGGREVESNGQAMCGPGAHVGKPEYSRAWAMLPLAAREMDRGRSTEWEVN